MANGQGQNTAQGQDAAQTILGPVQADDTIKAQAWEHFYKSANQDELTTRIRGLNLPDQTKAQLWEAKGKLGPGQPRTPPTAAQPSMRAQPTPFSPEWLKGKFYQYVADPTLQALPQLGGTVGGFAGGAAGAPGGPLGIGAGAVAGAGIGGMAGEAGKQLLSRALGFEAPQTSEEAARRIGTQGTIQSLLEVPSAALPGTGSMLERQAVSQYERAIRPTKEINKAIGREITPELIQRGERGSLSQLQLRAEDELARLNPELNQSYQALTAAKPQIRGAGTQVLADLEKMKQSYMPGGIVAKPVAVNAIQGVQDVIRQYGPDISPDNLRRLRQIFERVPGQRGAFAGIDLPANYTLEAEEQASNSIRGILNKEPDIGALNREMSFWLDVRRVLSETRLRQVGQTGGLSNALRNLASSGAGAVTAGLGLTGGASVPHSLEAGMAATVGTQAMALMGQAMRSPYWRTTSAVVKDRIAEALGRGDVRLLASVLSRVGLASLQGAPQPNQPPVANAPAQQ